MLKPRSHPGSSRPRQVSLVWTPEQYEALIELARQKGVSISALLWEAGYKLIEGRKSGATGEGKSRGV